MEYKDYISILAKLNTVDSIDNFIVKSIEFFLKRSNDTEILHLCNPDGILYEQIAEIIKNPQNDIVRSNMQKMYGGKKALRLIFNTIHTFGSQYICLIIKHVRADLYDTVEYNAISSILMDRYECFMNEYQKFLELK